MDPIVVALMAMNIEGSPPLGYLGTISWAMHLAVASCNPSFISLRKRDQKWVHVSINIENVGVGKSDTQCIRIADPRNREWLFGDNTVLTWAIIGDNLWRIRHGRNPTDQQKKNKSKST